MVVVSRSSHHACLLVLLLLSITGIGCKQSVDSPLVEKSSVGKLTKRFIFITNGDDPYFDVLNAGLQAGAEKYDLASSNIEVVMEKNNATAQGQINRLRQLVIQADIAAVAISVIQAENVAIVEEMKRLAEKGVPVITVDGDINGKLFSDARPFYIGTDNSIAGRLLGTAAKKVLESRGLNEGGFIQFTGFTDNDNARARMNGCRDALGKNYTELDRMADSFDHSRARDNVRTALVNHPDMTCFSRNLGLQCAGNSRSCSRARSSGSDFDIHIRCRGSSNRAHERWAHRLYDCTEPFRNGCSNSSAVTCNGRKERCCYCRDVSQ